MYFFESPSVYGHCGQVICKRKEESKGIRFLIGGNKKKIINDYLCDIDLDDSGTVFNIKPEKPFVLELIRFP